MTPKDFESYSYKELNQIANNDSLWFAHRMLARKEIQRRLDSADKLMKEKMKLPLYKAE